MLLRVVLFVADPAFNDSYRPDDITREAANDQMAPIASMDRTGSQDTVEYDKYDKPFDKGKIPPKPTPNHQPHPLNQPPDPTTDWLCRKHCKQI